MIRINTSSDVRVLFLKYKHDRMRFVILVTKLILAQSIWYLYMNLFLYLQFRMLLHGHDILI